CCSRCSASDFTWSCRSSSGGASSWRGRTRASAREGGSGTPSRNERGACMRRAGTLALVGALSLAGVAVGAQKTLQKATYTITTKDISVGLSANSSIPLTLGYWKAEGVDIDVTTLEGSTAGVQQLAAGNIQFATVGPETALIAREKGVKIKAFY